MAKDLNKAQLIGNLTRDPELRYTPQGTAVCSFSIATNRQWKTESGDTKEDAEFHRIVAWNQLAEICAKFLKKGSRTYVEGRLQTRQWEAQDGQKRQTTEIVISDMIMLDSRRMEQSTQTDDFNPPDDFGEVGKEKPQAKDKSKKETKGKPKKEAEKASSEEEEDIPF